MTQKHADSNWPTASRNADGLLTEAVSVKLLIEHTPKESRIGVTLDDLSPFGDVDNYPPTVSLTLERFLNARFGLSFTDIGDVDHDDVDSRVTERNQSASGPTTLEWDLSDEAVLAEIDWPVVGDEVAVVYQPLANSPPKEVTGTVTDATPMRTDEGLRYWTIDIGTKEGTTIEVDTRRQGTPVKEIQIENDNETLGDLSLVRHLDDEIAE